MTAVGRRLLAEYIGTGLLVAVVVGSGIAARLHLLRQPCRHHRPGPDRYLRRDRPGTMGCGDACPVYPGKRYLDWDLPDPAELPVEKIRPIRDDISRRVEQLLAELLATYG
jgi:hypothetical protein